VRRHRQIWDCKACGKRAYPTRGRAQEAINNHVTHHGYAGRTLPRRAYECPYGNGWHLTSQAERRTA
jgi:hypothetical protein